MKTTAVTFSSHVSPDFAKQLDQQQHQIGNLMGKIKYFLTALLVAQ